MIDMPEAHLLPDYNSPLKLKEFLNRAGFSMQKKFGQNFLIDETVRKALISFLVSAEKHGDESVKSGVLLGGTARQKELLVWEIGAGLGAMTELLLNEGFSVTAFEIDTGFALYLQAFFAHNPRFTLIKGDVRKIWRTALLFDDAGKGAEKQPSKNIHKKKTFKGGKKQISSASSKNKPFSAAKPDIIFGNLPYNISLELIFELVDSPYVFSAMLFTVQTEAAERITAQAGDKNYTALSVLCAGKYECSIVKTIPRSAFWPQPHVESAVLLFTPKKNSLPCKNPRLFTSLVKTLFSARRKTLKNNLSFWLSTRGAGQCTGTVLERFQSDGLVRAETLSLYQFLSLSDIVAEILEKNDEK